MFERGLGHAVLAAACMRRRAMAGALALLLTVGFLAGATGTASAQGTPPSDGTRPAVVPGNARSSANSVGISVRNGTDGSGANIAIDFGKTLATMSETAANLNARALDIDSLYLLLGPEAACPGQVPVVASKAPTAIANSSTPTPDGLQPELVNYPGFSGAPEGPLLGSHLATADSKPSGRGVTELPTGDFGIFSFKNSVSEVTTTRSGNSRSAEAVVKADYLSLLGGVVVLRDPTWRAVASDGGASGHEGSFQTGGGTFLGLPRTHDEIMRDLAGLGEAMGWLLGGLGFHLDLPKVTVETVDLPGGATGEQRVAVSPLVFRFTDMPLGRSVVRPVLETLGPWIEETEAELAEVCENRAGLQLLDILSDILAGQGTISVAVGGVLAATDDVWFPALAISPPTAAVLSQETAAPVLDDAEPELGFQAPELSTDFSDFDTFTGDFTSDDSTEFSESLGAGLEEIAASVDETAAVGDEELGSPVVDFDAGAVTRSTREGTLGRRALWAGLLAVLVGTGLAIGDGRLLRQTNRTIPDE